MHIEVIVLLAPQEPGVGLAEDLLLVLVDQFDAGRLIERLALGAAGGPLGFFIPMIYFWFLTGPAAMFVSIRYWNAPSSLVPRNKWRFIVAIVLALAQLIGFAFMAFAIVLALRGNPGLFTPRAR